MNDPVRAALAELVACIDWVETGMGMSRDEYRRREPLAWEAARRALAQGAETPSVPVAPNYGLLLCELMENEMLGYATDSMDQELLGRWQDACDHYIESTEAVGSAANR